MTTEDPVPKALDVVESPAARTRRRVRRDPTRARGAAPSRTRIWRERAFVPLALCALVAPMLFGGAFGWSVVVTSALAATAPFAVWLTYRKELAAIPTPLPVVVACGALAWTVLQALPLPMFLVRVLAPQSAEAVAMTAHAAGAAEPWFAALTRDPGGTASEIVKGAGIVACLGAAWAFANVGRRDVLVRIVAVSSVAMALVAAAHLALGEDKIFGIYQPIYAAPRVPAPLINTNHLANFLAMGVPLLLVLGAETKLMAWRMAAFLSAAMCAVLVVFTFSRGGIAALVVGVLCLVPTLSRLRDHGDDGRRPRTMSWVAVGVAFAAAAVAYVGADALAATAHRTEMGKLAAIGASLKLALQAPIFGVGRGAFSAAFAAHDGTDIRLVVPENIVGQWCSEWGFPVAIALGLAFGLPLLRAFTTTRRHDRAAAVAAVLAITLHDFVDFSLEMAGFAVVAAILLAAALAPDHEREGVPKDRGRWWPSLATLLLATSIVAVAAPALLGTRVVGGQVLELQQRLEHDLRVADEQDFQRTLSRALALHPAEPAFPLLAGADAVRRGDPHAMRWLTRAMQLAPAWASPHVESATYLWRSGHASQAILELREAARRSPSAAHALACHLARTTGDARVVLRAAPPGDPRIPFLDAVVARSCLPEDQAAIVDADLLSHSPNLASAVERNARRSIRTGHAEEAVRVLTALVRRDRDDATAFGLLAEALVASGRQGEAADTLAAAARASDDPGPILEQEARVRASAGDESGMRRTIEQLRGLAAGSSRKLGATMMLLGEIEDSRGNSARALHAYGEANRFDPLSGGLARVATICERIGDARGAFRAYAELCDQQGPGSSSCVARDRLAHASPAEPMLLLGQPTDGPPADTSSERPLP